MNNNTDRKFGNLVRGRRATWISKHLSPVFSETLKNLHNKPFTFLFAKKMSVPVPNMMIYGYSLYDTIRFAEDKSLDNFVIKPVVGRNSFCVAPLMRTSNKNYHHLVERESYDVDELIYRLIKKYKIEKIGCDKNGGKTELFNQWLIEDLIERPDMLSLPIDDFKFYAFYGEISLILHKRNFFLDGKWTSQFQWYDGDWKVINTGKYCSRIDYSLSAPPHKSRLTNMAKKISLKLPIPFCRIDLFDSKDGPILGELTTVPGDPDKFNGETDELLADNWQIATDKLIVDIKGGLLDDLKYIYFYPESFKLFG